MQEAADQAEVLEIREAMALSGLLRLEEHTDLEAVVVAGQILAVVMAAIMVVVLGVLETRRRPLVLTAS